MAHYEKYKQQRARLLLESTRLRWLRTTPLCIAISNLRDDGCDAVLEGSDITMQLRWRPEFRFPYFVDGSTVLLPGVREHSPSCFEVYCKPN